MPENFFRQAAQELIPKIKKRQLVAAVIGGIFGLITEHFFHIVPGTLPIARP